MTAWFFLVLVLVTCVTVAGSSWLPPGFLTWFWQTSVIVGDWLYIDGGEVWSVGQTSYSAVNQTFAIPLSTSWTNYSVDPVISSKPSNYEFSRRPALFYDRVDNSVFSWGGFTYDNGDSKTIWAFKPDGKGGAVWEERYSSGDNLWTRFTSPGGALSTQSSKAFYSLGGAMESNGNPSSTISGLAVFNFQNNAWTNLSSDGYSGCSCAILGQAQFVPLFGQDGLLVMLGGYSPASHTYSPGVDFRDMSNVALYDIHTGQWYHQMASGDVPPGREAFCMVGAQEVSNSSYELFMYGGATRSQQDNYPNSDFSDVFILSLPAFQWFRVPSQIGPTRSGHYCEVIGGRQMLVIGGGIASSGSISADPFTNGLGIFDITALKWTSGYDALAKPYVQSEPIKQYYMQNPRYPSSWNSTALGQIFTSSNGNPTSTARPPETSNIPSAHHPNAGAIAGGIVGSLVGVMLVLALGKYLLSRCRHQRRSTQNGSIHGSMAPIPPYELASGTAPRELGASDIADARNLRPELEGSTVIHEAPGIYH